MARVDLVKTIIDSCTPESYQKQRLSLLALRSQAEIVFIYD